MLFFGRGVDEVKFFFSNSLKHFSFAARHELQMCELGWQVANSTEISIDKIQFLTSNSEQKLRDSKVLHQNIAPEMF